MGKKIEVVLWTLIAASLVTAVVGHGTVAGTAGIACGCVCFALWVVSLFVGRAPYRGASTPMGAGASELVPRLRAARAGGAPLASADRAALEQLAANGELDAAVQKEVLDGVSRGPGPSRAADLAIATALLTSSAGALGSLLAALPALAADEAPRVAAAVARNQGLVARATPTLLADQALLGAFAGALADALARDPGLTPAPAPDLARALVKTLERDPARRATLEARMR